MTEKLTSSLKLELEKATNEFDRWVEKREEWLDTSKADFQRSFEEHQCTIEALKESERDLGRMKIVNEERKLQQDSEVDYNITYNSNLENRRKYVQEQLETFQNRLDQDKQKIEDARRENLEMKRNIEKSYNDLTRGIQYFQSLGLELEKAQGGCMRFIFTQINPKNPSQKFSFLMFVDDRDQYRLLECVPPIDSSIESKIMKTLNADNDITRFTVNMRRAFARTINS